MTYIATDISKTETAENGYKNLQYVIMGTEVESIVAKLSIKVLPNIIMEPEYIFETPRTRSSTCTDM